jgi:hypothetical protein
VGGSPIQFIDPTGLLVWFAVPVAYYAAEFVVIAGISAYAMWAIDDALDELINDPYYIKPPADSHDQDGSKAPGKPGEEEGFNDPKNGEDWVPNPNGSGSGWLDNKGNVWCPTGGKAAHGGEHWDVQKPGKAGKPGKHVNIYPGGRKR